MQDIQQTLNVVFDAIRAIWLKKRFIMVCSWIICPLGFLYTASMPDVYESEAQVFVDTRSMLQPILAGLAFSTNPEQEIQMMATTLKSRANIETIARESDLDITVTTDNEYNELISDLTKDIELKATGKDNIYTISYSHPRPEMARTVVQETLDLFVEGSLGSNRRDTDNVTRFIDEEIAEYETRLAEAEQRVANFQRQYSEILPLQGTFYNNLQNMRSQLESTQLSIKEAVQQIEALKGQRQATKQAADGFGVRSTDDTAIITTKYDERILALEERIDQLRLRFTEKHPDVVESTSLLANLRELREREINAFLTQDTNDNPNGLSGLDREIKLEIGKLEGMIASLQVREADTQRKIAELQSKIDLVPQIEAEQTALNRDYGITKQKYEELLSRKEAAEISRRAEVSSEELQFKIIKPPMVPAEPTGPVRIVFYTGFLFVGFGIGTALAFLVSLLNPILVRGQQLQELTGYPIWGAVTHLHIDQVKRRNRFRIAIFVASSGLIVCLYAILVAADVMNIDIATKVLA